MKLTGLQMTEKFTPGPWEMHGPTGLRMQSYSQPYAIVGTGEYATTLIAGCFGDTRGGLDAAKANAYLIAAATEMYKLLIEARDKGVSKSWLERRDAVIKKARGEK